MRNQILLKRTSRHDPHTFSDYFVILSIAYFVTEPKTVQNLKFSRLQYTNINFTYGPDYLPGTILFLMDYPVSVSIGRRIKMVTRHIRLKMVQ